jgi:gas vesicle protein
MNSENQNSNFMGVLAGLVIGSVAGATAMLLLAPQSGKETRKYISDKGIELRDQTTGMFDDAVAQVRTTTNKLSMDGRDKAKELKQQGQDLISEQLDRVSAAAQAGKKAIQTA